MHMAYSKSPYLPRVRMLAVRAVYQGKRVREVARYFGVCPGTISKWVRRDNSHGWRPIETESSRPHHHPRALPQDIIREIVREREKHQRSSEVLYEDLKARGITVSLSSIKRTLKRRGLTRVRSPWKRWHVSEPRPVPQRSGDLVQVDTIHIMISKKTRIYVYTLIDLYSRWAYAWASDKANVWRSWKFVRRAQTLAPFRLKMLQSDHGSEWSAHFTERVRVTHRHSRVRQSNDNAHIERFNRTVQEECLDQVIPSVTNFNRALKAWLWYYNHERRHFGLKLKTPAECFQAID